MLTLYRRHKESCKHANDRYYRRCTCAVWAEGVVEAEYIRRSLKTRSWERGEELRRELETKSGVDPTPAPRMTTVADA